MKKERYFIPWIFPFVLFIAFSTPTPAQLVQFELRSQVTNQKLEGIAGVYIKNYRTDKFALTNEEGMFTIICQQNDSLLLTAMGYEIMKVFVDRIDNERIILKEFVYELKTFNVYDFKSWESFREEFITKEIPREEVNTKGIPQGKSFAKPPKYRANTFKNPPTIFQYRHVFSTLAYYLSDEEAQKRHVWAMIQKDLREKTYYGVCNADSVPTFLNVADSLLDDFIVYCHIHIEDKTLTTSYEYKAKIGELYPIFLKEKKNKK